MHLLPALDFWLLDTDALGGWLLPLLLLWIMIALSMGRIAGDQGRGRVRWVLVALVITPVLAYPLLRHLGRLGTSQEHTMPLGDEVTRCVSCGETVSASLSRCTNCGDKLPGHT